MGERTSRQFLRWAAANSGGVVPQWQIDAIYTDLLKSESSGKPRCHCDGCGFCDPAKAAAVGSNGSSKADVPEAFSGVDDFVATTADDRATLAVDMDAQMAHGRLMRLVKAAMAGHSFLAVDPQVYHGRVTHAWTNARLSVFEHLSDVLSEFPSGLGPIAHETSADRRVAELEKQLAEVARQRNDAWKDINEISSESVDFQAERDQAISAMDNLARKLTEAEDMVATVRAERDILYAENKASGSELVSRRETAVKTSQLEANLRKQLTEAEAARDELRVANERQAGTIRANLRLAQELVAVAEIRPLIPAYYDTHWAITNDIRDRMVALSYGEAADAPEATQQGQAAEPVVSLGKPAWTDADIDARNELIQSGQAEVRRLESELDHHTSTANKLVAERDAAIAERDAEIASLHAELTKVTAQSDGFIEATMIERRLMEKRDATIAALRFSGQKVYDDAKAELAERDIRLSQLYVELAKLKQFTFNLPG